MRRSEHHSGSDPLQSAASDTHGVGVVGEYELQCSTCSGWRCR